MARSTFSITAPAQCLRAPTSGQFLLMLDFDGVTHPVPDASLPTDLAGVDAGLGKQFFTATPMAEVRALIEALDAGIVVISSWRLLPIPLAWFDRLFDGRVLGATEEADADVPPRRARETEIDRWLRAYAPTNPFAILDDTRAHYKLLESRLVSPTPTVGMTPDDAAQVRALATRA